MPKSRLLAFLIKELREIVGATAFFAVGFNLIVLTTRAEMIGLISRLGTRKVPETS